MPPAALQPSNSFSGGLCFSFKRHCGSNGWNGTLLSLLIAEGPHEGCGEAKLVPFGLMPFSVAVIVYPVIDSYGVALTRTVISVCVSFTLSPSLSLHV